MPSAFLNRSPSSSCGRTRTPSCEDSASPLRTRPATGRALSAARTWPRAKRCSFSSPTWPASSRSRRFYSAGGTWSSQRRDRVGLHEPLEERAPPPVARQRRRADFAHAVAALGPVAECDLASDLRYSAISSEEPVRGRLGDEEEMI